MQMCSRKALLRFLPRSPGARLACLLIMSISAQSPIYALPQGAEINAGHATFIEDSGTLRIQQGSDKLSVNYQGFDIEVGEAVIFEQPSISSVALNRVVGNNASQIFGDLQANGQVFLINPNGIVFGDTAHIDVGGLLASTLDLSDEDFLNGQALFSGAGAGAIVNEGLIEAASNGYIMMVSPYIQNSGALLAPQGQVVLESADEVLLDFSGQSVAILADAESLDALIENEGLIEAQGGQVILNAAAHDSLHQTVVNNTGIIRATRMEEVNGEIIISGGEGDVANTGLLDVSAAAENISGGTIALTANRISQVGDLKSTGEGLGHGGEVSVQAKEALLITQGHSDVSGGLDGDGGELIYFADGATLFTDTASLAARSGEASGDGGFIEVSGLDFVAVEGQVDASSKNGAAGTFLIDPTNIEITNVQNNGIFSAIIGGFEWFPSGGGTPSQVDAGTLSGLLAGGNNVVVDTARVDTGGDIGTLSVLADIDLNGGNGQSLSLVADDSITFAANVKIQDSDTGTPDAVNVNLTSSNNITFNNDADIFTTGGNATVIASNNLVMSGNSSIQTDTGTISVIANNVSLIGKLDSNSALDNAISINSATQIADSGASTIDIEAPNGGIVLQAGSGIAVDIAAAKVDIQNSTSGTVTIEGTGDLEVLDVDVYATGPVSILKNNENGNSSGSVTFSGYTGSGSLTVTSDADISVSDAVLVDVGASTIDLDANGDISLGAGSSVESTAGDITLRADLDGNNIGDISLGAASNFNAGAGLILAQAENIESGQGAFTSTNTGANAVTLTAANNINDLGLAGTMATAASGGIVLNANGIVDALTESQQLALTNTGGGNNTIDLASTDTTVSTLDVAGNLTMLTRNAASDLSIDSVTTLGGNVSITATRNLTLNDSLNSAGGNITLEASNGTLILQDAGISTANDLSLTAQDIIDSDRAVSLSAGALTLITQTAAGDSVFNTAASSLDLANGGTNQITVNETDNLSITGLAGSGGNVTVNTLGVGNLTLNSGIDLDGWNGSALTLDAANTLQISSNRDILDSATASVDTVDINLNAGNEVFVQINNEIFSYGGDITINAGGDFDTRNASDYHSGTGKISVNAGDVSLISFMQSNNAASDAITIVSGDRIVDAGGANLDIQATNGGVILQAVNGIDIDTNVVELDIANTASGNIVIEEANALNLNALSFAGGNATISTASGNLSVVNAIDLNGSNGGTLTLDAANNLIINANVCDGGAACAVTSDDDANITLLAGNNLSITGAEIDSGGGDITLDATSSFAMTGPGIRSGSGIIDLNANSVFLNSNLESNSVATNAISVTSATNIVDGGGAPLDISASNGGVILNAATGIDIDTDVMALDITNTTSGNIVIDENNSVDLLNLVASGGDVTISTQNSGDLTVSSAIDLDTLNGQNLSLIAATDLLLNQSMRDTTGPRDHDVNLTFSAGNNVNMGTGNTFDAGAGVVNVTATGGSARLGSLVSDDTSNTAIQVSAGSQISDGFTGNNVTAPGGGVVLSAVNGISDGPSFYLNLLVDRLNLTNTAGGLVWVGQGGQDLSITNWDVVGSSLITTNTANLDIQTGSIANIDDLSLDVDGVLSLPNAGLNIGSNPLDISANDIVDAAGRDIDLVASNLTLSTAAAAGDLNVFTTTDSLSLTNSGTNFVTVQDVDDLSLLSLSSSGRAAVVSNAVLTIPDAGLNIGTSELLLGGTDIVDVSGRELDITAGHLSLTSAASGGDLTLNSAISSLNLTNTGTNAIRFNEADALTITNLVSANGEAAFSMPGNLTIPDTGLNLGTNNLSISAADIVDPSGRTLDFTANELSLEVTSPFADSVFNTSANALQLISGGAADLTINETDALVLSDLNAGGFALSSNSGDVTLNAGALQIDDAVQLGQGNFSARSNGAMQINASISASDSLADGIREGLIDLAVNGADLSLGTASAVSIVSTNTVDPNAGGGLDADPASQIGIRIRQLDASDSTRAMVLGDDAGNDVLLRAIGSDVYIDSEGGASLTGGNTRLVTLNSDVTLESYNALADAADGTVSLASVSDNGVTAIARTGRFVQVNALPAPPVAPPVIPEVDEDELVSVVQDKAADSGESNQSTEVAIDEQVEADSRQVSRVFERAFGGCQSGNEEHLQNANCRQQKSLVKFLGAFMIGGELSGL